MKYLIAFLILASTALAEMKQLTWVGNNPPNSVNYMVEVNRQNPADDSKWFPLTTTQDEFYLYDEGAFGRTYYRVKAQALTNDIETGLPIESGYSNVVSTVVVPNGPEGLEVTN